MSGFIVRVAESIMMLEADVIMGTLNGSVEVQPIMGHPPSDTGDLSLNQFINRITEYNSQPAHKSSRRGIKLDFKSLSVYNKSIDYLKTNFPMSVSVGHRNESCFSRPVGPTPIRESRLGAHAGGICRGSGRLGEGGFCYQVATPKRTTTFPTKKIS